MHAIKAIIHNTKLS